jgi:hypothetical protein
VLTGFTSKAASEFSVDAFLQAQLNTGSMNIDENINAINATINIIITAFVTAPSLF